MCFCHLIGHEDAHASENASELDTSKSKHAKASKVFAAEVMAEVRILPQARQRRWGHG